MVQTLVKRWFQSRVLSSEHSAYYYFFVLLVPVSFLLHAMNENFGLIGNSVILRLFLRYCAIAVVVAFFSKMILRNFSKALCFSFGILLIYFLFGPLKNFLDSMAYINRLVSYRFLLPALFVAIFLCALFLKRSRKGFHRLRLFLQVFLLINLVIEMGWAGYNVLRFRKSDIDFGDPLQSLVQKKNAAVTSKPTIFWLVFDEYPASSTLQKVWNFHNPLDSILTSRGFFVARDAISNYNFTHYSLTSTLDMVYLNKFSNHSVVTPKDMARGIRSLNKTNTSALLEKNGYSLRNYTFYDIENYPAMGQRIFENLPESLVDFQTFWTRTKTDIGWNFLAWFDPNGADSGLHKREFRNIDQTYKKHWRESLESIHKEKSTGAPVAFMIHVMLPHEPFIYDRSGSILHPDGLSEPMKDFIPQLQYTNSVVAMYVDSILNWYRTREFVIVVQGDHGFKFSEEDPSFETESNKIFFAVYCSDRDYGGWYHSLSSVNGFRILFNKYLDTGFPMLKDTAFNLLYRQK